MARSWSAPTASSASAAIGLHIWLHCADWEASTVLSAYLDEVVTRLEARTDLTVRVSKEGVSDSSDWR